MKNIDFIQRLSYCRVISEENNIECRGVAAATTAVEAAVYLCADPILEEDAN